MEAFSIIVLLWKVVTAQHHYHLKMRLEQKSNQFRLIVLYFWIKMIRLIWPLNIFLKNLMEEGKYKKIIGIQYNYKFTFSLSVSQNTFSAPNTTVSPSPRLTRPPAGPSLVMTPVSSLASSVSRVTVTSSAPGF